VLQWVTAVGKPRTLSLEAVREVLAGQQTAVFRCAHHLVLGSAARPACVASGASQPNICASTPAGVCRACSPRLCLSLSSIATITQSGRWTSSARCVSERTRAFRLTPSSLWPSRVLTTPSGECRGESSMMSGSAACALLSLGALPGLRHPRSCRAELCPTRCCSGAITRRRRSPGWAPRSATGLRLWLSGEGPMHGTARR
jgi:hypothetical protein